MPVFRYSARSETGLDSSGALFAPSEDMLYQTLRKQGLFLLRCRPSRGHALNPHRLRIKPRQLLAFTIHISTYQQSGIPLMQTLNALARESFGVRFQTMVEGLITQISGGAGFSEALAQYPRIFDPYYIQMVATGEASGQLDKRMEDLVRHLEWQQEIRSQVRQSSTYPLLLIGLLLGVVVLMMTFTLPKFVKLLLQFNAELPVPTRIVIGVSNAFSSYWYLLPLLPGIPYLIYSAAKRTAAGRLRLDRLKLKVPVFGSLHRKIAISRFAHHFSCLHEAGIDTLSALRIVEGLTGNRVISGVLAQVRRGVEAGKSLSQQFSQSSEFPPFVIQMLAAGEESGNLETTLKKVAQYYDREIPAAIKRAFTIIEPVVLIAMGGLVAFIALSILLPIYEFGASINK
ncbi:MAG: type II secretion system F family protein [Acidobacteriota bacterium]|nr:type II secretion system F family protein [Acidobacteriota bacterium]